VPGHELLHDDGRPVVDGDPVAVIGQVEREVLAHHGAPDQSDVSAGTSDILMPDTLPQPQELHDLDHRNRHQRAGGDDR
jgi:hypothetical protein